MSKAKVAAESKAIAAEVIGYIDDVAKQQVKLAAHNERGNTALYEILAEVMNICEYVEACDNTADIVKKLRSTLKTERGIQTQAKSTMASIIIKCLVPTSRKTQCVYAGVIKAAKASGISHSGLVEYIRANNGIENVRKIHSGSKTKAAKSVDADIADTSQKLLRTLCDTSSKQRLGVVKLEGIKSVSMLHDRCELTNLMCRDNKVTGELEVVAVAYPTLQLQNLVLNNYVTALQLAALQNTNEFCAECKSVNADMDTVNTWREANGMQAASQAIALLASIGVSLDADKVRRTNEAEAAASKRLALANLTQDVDVDCSKQSASQPSFVIAA